MTLRDLDEVMTGFCVITIGQNNDGSPTFDGLDRIENLNELSKSPYYNCDIHSLDVNFDKGTLGVSLVDEDAERVASPIQYNKYKKRIDKCKDRFAVKQIVGFIYGLYEDFEISEGTEIALYQYIDPDEKFNNPSAYWDDWYSENPLEYRKEKV